MSLGVDFVACVEFVYLQVLKQKEKTKERQKTGMRLAQYSVLCSWQACTTLMLLQKSHTQIHCLLS